VQSNNAKAAKSNIDIIKKEIRNLNIKILPPDINKSDIQYKMMDEKTLLTGLDALKFVGDEAIKDIILKRPFNNFDDFMQKIDPSKVKINTIQAFAVSGCFDNFGLSRKSIFLYSHDYRKKYMLWIKKHNPKEFIYPFPEEQDWSLSEKYALEYKYIGEAFICNKVNAFGNFYKNKINTKEYLTLDKILNLPNKTQIPSIVVEIKNIFEFKVKKEKSKFYGKPMLKVLIEDEKGNQLTTTIFPDRYEQIQKRIKTLYKNKIKLDIGQSIHFSGSVNIYEDEIGVILNDFYDLSPAPEIPKDLNPRKISLKNNNENKKIVDINIKSDDLAALEEELFDAGVIDIDDNETGEEYYE
jgi:DNA polymerase III alpha subunit